MGTRDLSNQSATVQIFGITIHNVSMQEALHTIMEEWMSREGERPFVTTPNVDHVVKLQRDPEFREVYRHASLVVADGMPIVWASWLCRAPLKERVTGSDLFPRICERAAQANRSVFFLGSLSGVAVKAAENLKRRLPGLAVAGCYSPPFGFEHDEQENRRICAMINAARPDILFVGLGAPKQEKWLYRHRSRLYFKAALCVGASLDYEAGVVRRAPRWMQGAGLEWLWRLVQDPGRLWKRYLVEDLAFLSLYLRELRRGHPVIPPGL